MTTNLERAAAIAAERGWPLVEVYRGWAIYRPHALPHRPHPHRPQRRG